MSTTVEACDELRDSIRDACGPASAAVASVIRAQRALPVAGDNIIDVMRACIDLILATEAAKDAFDYANDFARKALAASMANTGASNISTATHTAGLRRVPPKAIVTGTVPEEFMSVPEPRPDMAKIKKALGAGPLTWATLSNGSGETLAITSRRQA